MAREPLSRLDDWELVDDDKDIRGETLMDMRGNRIGTVEDMIVDTDVERVVAIRLDNGMEYPIADVEDRDGQVVLMSGATTTPTTTAYTREVEMPERETTAMYDRDRMATTTTTEGRTIPLHEEELVAGKEMRPAGEVEIRKDVVTEHKTMEVPVSHEEVVIERHPVDRRPADRPIGEGETVEVPIREEHATAEKRPYVAEEVTVGKRTVRDTERVEGEVRKEVLDVDTEGDVRMSERRDRT